MDPQWRHPYGLRPTLRQMMIVVVFAALAAAVFKATSELERTLLLPFASPLLALAVAVLDRPGPAKFWLAGLIASLFVPLLAATCDLAIWRSGVGGPVPVVVLLCANAAGMIGLHRVARRLPQVCPGCGLRSRLPLGRHAAGMRWCASCGLTERRVVNHVVTAD